MFYIVHFTSPNDDSVQTVPSTWVNFVKELSQWPTGPKAQNITTSLVKNLTQPETLWPWFPVRIFKGTGNLHNSSFISSPSKIDRAY